jgi:hypothetical protein
MWCEKVACVRFAMQKINLKSIYIMQMAQGTSLEDA